MVEKTTTLKSVSLSFLNFCVLINLMKKSLSMSTNKETNREIVFFVRALNYVIQKELVHLLKEIWLFFDRKSYRP